MTKRRLKTIAGTIMVLVAGGVCSVSTDALALHPLRGEFPGQGVAQSGAPAPANVKADVMVLHATNVDGGVVIDPRIGELPALRKPPFSAFNSYKLLSQNAVAVSKDPKDPPATTTLPNGRVLQIALREVKDNRYRVATSISDPSGKSFLPLLEVTAPAGEPFFVAGQSYNGGMLVVGIKIKSRPITGARPRKPRIRPRSGRTGSARRRW